MIFLNSKKFLLTVFSFLLIGAVSFLNFPNIKLFVWGVKADLPSWENYNLGGRESDSIELIWADSKMRIEKSVPEDNGKFINDKREALKLLFEPTTSPYPEFITNIVKCDDEFRSKEETVKNGVIYSLYAGERFNYGVCSQDLIKYYSKYGLFDCGRKGVFEVNLFGADNDQIDKVVKSFSCN